jgi:tetratricopeptide (TPR) repeat protein
MDAAENLVHFYSKYHTLGGDNATSVEGFLEGAQTALDEALKFNPQLVDAAAYRIWAAAQRCTFDQRVNKAAGGNMTDFITQANELSRQFPHSAVVLEVLGMITEMAGDYRGALKHMDAAIGIEPRNVRFLMERAKVKAKYGDCEGGRADMKRAADSAGKDAAADFDFVAQRTFGEESTCGLVENRP